jgi:biotin/methionine sulfoxide reductase
MPPLAASEGDLVRLFNARGACLAAAHISDGVMPGVINLSTGAWYDPLEDGATHPLCIHGNPNVLTRDLGTSRLAQGSCGQVTVVNVEKFTGNLPPIQAYDPPVPVIWPRPPKLEAAE